MTKNEGIIDALWEDFHCLYDSSKSFMQLVNKMMHPFVAWYNEQPDGRYDDRSLLNVFNKLLKFDRDLFLKDMRTCVEAYLMYVDSINRLEVLADGRNNN